MHDGWVKSTLGEVCEIVGGGTPSTKEAAYWGGDITWLSPTEVVRQDGRRISASERTITEEGLARSSAKLLPPGTVLLTTRASVGFVAIADCTLATNQGFQSLICGPELIPAFLMHWVQANRDEFRRRAGGSTFPEVSKAKVKAIPITYPPLAVQRRILDLMEHLDNQVNLLRAEAHAVRVARHAAQSKLVGFGASQSMCSLGDLIDRGEAETFRGKVISKKTMAANPGSYPVYSSAQGNNGAIGQYGDYMFDEELITWSVDGGGHLFYRPRHRFSVTNIGGVLRILATDKWDYRFLFYSLDWQHGLETFDWQSKAHPSVIRNLYSRIPLLPLSEQRRIADLLWSFDETAAQMSAEETSLSRFRQGALSNLLNGQKVIPEAYDELLGVAS